MIYICKLQSHVIDCQSSNQEEKEGKKFTSVGEGASATENTQYFGEWSLASDEVDPEKTCVNAKIICRNRREKRLVVLEK